MKTTSKKTILIMTSVVLLTLFSFTRLVNSEIVQLHQSATVEKSLKRVQGKVHISAPIDEVWTIIGENFDQNYKFSVEAEKTYYLKKVDGMIGSQRRTTNYKGKVVDVEIVEYDQKKAHIKWDIFNMNVAPLKAGNSSYTLFKDDNGGTILIQKAAFKMKVFFMNGIAMKKFTALFKTQLAAIKHLAETGEHITPENKDKIVDRYSNSIEIMK